MNDPNKTKRKRRGQLIPRGADTYLLRVPLHRDPATGKRAYHNETFHGTRAKAEKRITEVLASVDAGTFFEPSPVTLDGLMERYFTHLLRQGRRDITVDCYRANWKIYLRERIGALPLSKVTPLVLQEVFDSLVDRGLAPLTVRNIRSPLTGAMRQAVRWRMIKENPSAGVVTPHGKRKPVRAMDEREAARFVTAARASSKDLIFVLVFYTGLRPAEFIGLRWADIELVSETRGSSARVEYGVAHIRQTVVRKKGGGWQFCEPKTEKGAREVYFPAAIHYDLMGYKAAQDAYRRGYGHLYKDSGLVFAARNGEPLHRGNLALRRFKPLLKDAGLSESFSLYTLRRTFATLLRRAGVSAKEVSEQMGHTNVNFTDAVYVSVLDSAKREMSDALEKVLFPDSGTLPQQVADSHLM